MEISNSPKPSGAPRRVRVSPVEIGLAVAVTLAAIAQLLVSLTQRDGKVASGTASAYIRPHAATAAAP